MVGMMFATFSFTYSRSSYVAMLGSLLVLAWISKKWASLLVGILIIGGLMIGLPNVGGEGTNLLRTQSIVQRLSSQSRAIEVWKSKPVLGVGFNAYPKYLQGNVRYDYLPRHPSAPDNSYLFVLATTGVIGVVAFLYLGFRIGLVIKREKMLVASLVAVGIHALFNNSVFFPWVMVWMMTMVAEKVAETKVDI